MKMEAVRYSETWEETLTTRHERPKDDHNL